MSATVATHLVFKAAGPMPLGLIMRSYLAAARYELMQALRAPVFSFPFLLLPAVLYFLFGVLMANQSPESASATNPQVATFLLAGFCAFAVMGPGIFGFGVGLAIERDQGLLNLKRAQPGPAGAHLFAKMAMSVICAALAAGAVALVAVIAGKLVISYGQLLTLVGVMIAGSLPFCAIGLLIGAYVSGNASPAVANLVYLPGMWLLGSMFPLPESMRPWAVIWPMFHLNQTALGAAGVKELSFVNPTWTAAVLVAITVLCTGLALRRLARVG